MINKYIVYTRFQFVNKEGKKDWGNWFISDTNSICSSEQSANERIKELKTNVKEIDKVTKLSHDFEVRQVDLETLPHPKVKFGKSGRPTKEEAELNKIANEDYWKNQTFKN